jgi:hypothetical protein
LRGLDALAGGAGSTPAIELAVNDRNGAVWHTEQLPRWPIFVLQFAEPPQAPERHLFLMRGSPSPELLADLSSPQLRAATQAQRLGLTLELAGGALLRARPTGALEPGGRYALVWADLHGQQQFALVVSASPAAGARLVQTLPGLLERQVPPNLTRILLRFDGYLRGDVQNAVRLEGADGVVPCALQALACAELGLDAGDCLQVTPERELAPGARYAIALDGALQDATGAALPAQQIAFDTAPERDQRAPTWLHCDCALDEQSAGPLCLLLSDSSVALRARADENGVLSLWLGGELRASLAQSGDYALEMPLAAPGEALLQLEDLAGNSLQLQLPLAPASDLPKLSIDELRVDALGPEPSQEYVELLNFGETAMSITGFSLSTDARTAGQRIESEHSLAPGERALLVAPDFDPQDTRDEAPAQGVRLVRLPAALGLRNEGSALYLRDPHGRRVSAAPALAPERPGQCIVRSGADPRSGKRADFTLDARGGCTPGYASDDAPRTSDSAP